MQYLLMIYSDEAAMAAVTEANGGKMLAAYGAYAEAMGGLGVTYRVAALPWLRLSAEAAVGVGGAGANVDTGGGLLAKLIYPAIGLFQYILFKI